MSLNAVDIDPAGNAWAVGTAYTSNGREPARWNTPGDGQGGIAVDSNAGNAALTWIGPANGAGTTGSDGGFTVGGLPAGTYTVIASYGGCTPGVATAAITAGRTTPVQVQVAC